MIASYRAAMTPSLNGRSFARVIRGSSPPKISEKSAVTPRIFLAMRTKRGRFHRNLTPVSSRPHRTFSTMATDDINIMQMPQQDVQFRPQGTIDVPNALLPYKGPWSPRLAAHLLRRAGFGGSATEIQSAASAGMDATVGRLLHPAPDMLPSAPDGDLSFGPMVDPMQRRAAFMLTLTWWLDRMLLTPAPLVERMVYFWHNHFTSAIDGGITPEMMVAQNTLFRRHAFGSFADLTHAVARDPAMLLYLNGNQN